MTTPRPRTRLIVAIVASIALFSPASALAAPFHGVDAWFDFSNTPFAATNMVENRVNITRSAPSQYYAVYWQYMFGGDGYMGLQSDGRMPVTNQVTNLFRFSMWGANGFRNVAASGRCADFGHEGSGIECAMPFWFATNRWYVYQVKDVGSDASGRWWEASIKDEVTGQWFSLAQIRTPHTSFITTVVQFTESFVQPVPDDCSSIRASEVVFIVPFGAPRGGSPAHFNTITYPSPCSNASATNALAAYGAISMRMGR
jgi:hypothetical protein